MSKICLQEDKIEQYRKEFSESKCIFIPDLIEKSFLKELLLKIDKASFYEKEEADEYKFGKVLFVPQNEPSVFILNLLLNDRKLFSMLEKITACRSIKDFVGRIHRSEGEQHGINWHGDNFNDRLLAITLGLGNDKYGGAEFQLREKGSEKLLGEFGQLEAGNAIIFQIAPHLEHRLAPIKKGRRTVGVGWFRG
ncbi:MAG: 2OG-Fe(II) oxygenase [Flavobacteriales bacterium]